MPKPGSYKPINYALKMAIFASGHSQQDVAREAFIQPQKLSHAIYGRRELMPWEQKRLAKVLRRSLTEIFPDDKPLPLPKLTDEVAT